MIHESKRTSNLAISNISHFVTCLFALTKVDKIKGKYAKDNSAEMENAFSDNPPLQISNQNLLAKTKHSLNTLTSSNTKTEISELSFPVSLISPTNQGGYFLKSSDKTFHFKSPYTPPLSSKNSRYAGKNPGSKLQMFS